MVAFQAETILERADFMALSHVLSSRKPAGLLGKLTGVMRVLVRIIMCAVGGSMALMGIISLWLLVKGLIFGSGLPYKNFWSLFSPFFVTILGLFFILRFKGGSQQLGELSWKQYNGKGTKIMYSFFAEGFTQTLLNSEHRYDYSVIKGICHDAERYYLFTGSQAAHVIRIADFTVGNPSQFGLFIAQRTQLPVDVAPS